MADLTQILGGPWKPPSERVIDPPELQLRKAMMEAGLTPPDQIWLDGKVHRFSSNTKGKPGHGDKPGWYVAYSDGVPAGRFGCWRLGVEVTWKAEVGRQLTMTEHLTQQRRIEEAKAARDAEQARKHEVAASTVQLIWSDGATASPDHPYLQRKGIKVHGARVTGDGRLMVPLYTPNSELSSLQYISADGDKKYHSGGATGGCYWWLGAIEEAKLVYVAEGFATAATIHEATGQPVFVAYSASNLVPVTGMLRERMAAPIVIVADNDASGVGQRYAEQASAKYGARFIVPPIEGDANDYVQAGHNLAELLTQQTGKAVTEKLKVVFGDELSSEYEAPNELVEGLMAIGESVVVYGDSNSGKTFWALSVATAIASGTDCYGRKTDPGLVVYLASEAPASIRSRMQAIKKYHGCSLANLAMVPVPLNFYASGDQDAQDVIELVKAVEQMKSQPVRLIIGDTLARMSAGANENSGEDMGPVMARFDQVATATGATMMIIHHNGKDAAKGARGWSGIRAHIDTEIEVTEKDGIRSASVTKQRQLPSKGETIYFRLEVIEMGITKFGSAATTCVAVPDSEAATTKPHKKPTKHDENVRTIERAWWASGAEERNGLPYVSRQALRDLLINDGMSERTAKNKTEASRQDGIILPLLNAGTLAALDHGWIFINEAQASALFMQKNAPKRP